jgi:hypothetical protein
LHGSRTHDSAGWQVSDAGGSSASWVHRISSRSIAFVRRTTSLPVTGRSKLSHATRVQCECVQTIKP